MGVVEAETLQVVVGPGKAKKVADLLVSEFGILQASTVTEDWESNKEAIKKDRKQSKLKTGLETIAGIFVPLIPAIIAAGIFNGFSNLIGTMQQQGGLPEGSQMWDVIRLVFALIGTSFLGYFAIFTGVNAAKRFGATEAFGGMIGAMSIAAQIVNISQLFGLYDADVPLNSILTTGKGGIIGVIIGVYILAKVEKAVRKRVPDVLDLIITPIVTLLTVAVLFVFIIMPVSGVLSDWLVSALSIIIGSENAIISIISGYILAALFLPMVLLGLHHGLIPIYAIQLEAFGGVSLFPVLAMAGAGQVGAAIAIYMISNKVKNDRMKQVIAGALPAGILGIGEPLIYGVTLPLGKPFITAGLGAGFGGAYVMATNVMATAWGPSGVVAIPLMQTGSMLNFIFGILISYIGGFAITRLFIKDEDVANV
ncbi:PTS system, sucrose-specific IIC component [Natronincola peptidivorans]|uniref:PTS system, sucrose-specific IIC component n=1 Tax=Natronincola peptidivorans TaxID=426128 RepID=A0A1I0ARR1_9FIRM|nr:PTS transporter subunit EIIC [Natronincola peptidivorans]SES97074.1 PTS system, sucrose-specific IIC component [Natronincola peptidivorans]